MSTFENEYPGINICQDNSFQHSSMRDPKTNLKLIKILMKKNCTHMEGSLYLKGFINLGDFKELNLDSIMEINGHLVIENNDIEKISFKNLRIIRGLTFLNRTMVNSSLRLFTLYVAGNLNLQHLDLSSLRAIGENNVMFGSNPKLTFLPHRINWEELFTKPESQKMISTASRENIFQRDKCSSKCQGWTNENKSFCWGPSESQCQQKVLCRIYKETSSCETCIFENGKEINCCDDQCFGGCTGFGPTKCIACKSMMNGNRCINTCPGKHIGGIGGTTLDKEFKYHTGSFCTKTCPVTMLPEDTVCVHKCSDGYFKNKSNHCERCYGNMCNKENIPCIMSQNQDHGLTLTNITLMSLKNCTKIRGYIALTKSSFTRKGVTVQMLYDNLEKVEEIEGGFNYFIDDNLKNLTFLSNLKFFRAAVLQGTSNANLKLNRFIIANTSLEFLGLRSLKTVESNFLFSKNSKLCYMNFPWSDIQNGNYKMRNDKLANCIGKTCHPECSDKECWGPGNQMCFTCRHLNASGTCVSSCSDIKGFYLKKNDSNSENICQRCHEECKVTCFGPGSHECVNGCLNKNESGICVPQCSKNFYQPEHDSKICLPCHSNCSESPNQICTGPSSVPGKGGCNKCNKILLDRQDNIVNCVKDCPSETYPFITNDMKIKEYILDFGYTCLPCHNLCSKCQGKSDKKDSCEICTGFWLKERCVSKCPKGESYGFDTINGSRICNTCHHSCALGCKGPTNGDCIHCKDRKIYTINTPELKKFYCDKSCPSDKPEMEIEDLTRQTVCVTIEDSKVKKEERKKIKVIICIVLPMFFIALLAIIIVLVCLRRKAFSDKLESELKAKYSNLLEPNSKNEDMLDKPPNMGRLVIVSKEDLTVEDKTRPLGFGAFGYVYKGKWRISMDENSLLKKPVSEFYLPVAIKVIKNVGNDGIEPIMQEAKIMASVSHMHCLRFIGICLSYEKPCLISAYVKEGSLDKYLVRNKTKITSLIMLSWSEQIADGMLYLTRRNIIHRDLAARNVLVNRLECVQITDFGLSKMLESKEEKEIIIKTGKVPIRWLSIETLTEGKYSHETDVWAYGVTLWEIFTFGKIPYEDHPTHDIFDFVMKGGRLLQPEICSLDVYIVMINCWLESPNLRPDFLSLMKTFMEYCKNPGRYLSIKGDPYEIQSPVDIEMTNLNNQYLGYHNGFDSTTKETKIPLLGNDTSVHSETEISHDKISNDMLNSNFDKELLPTRSNNKINNPFKLFQENHLSPNPVNSNQNNTSKFEDLKKNHLDLKEDDPRYVADPTDISPKIIHQQVKTPLLNDGAISHNNIKGNFVSNNNINHLSQVSDKIEESDDYLEPVKNKYYNHQKSTDTDDYLEPVNKSNKSTGNGDQYIAPSQQNHIRDSTSSVTSEQNAKLLDQPENYLTMDDANNDKLNSFQPHNLINDNYFDSDFKYRAIK